MGAYLVRLNQVPPGQLVFAVKEENEKVKQVIARITDGGIIVNDKSYPSIRAVIETHAGTFRTPSRLSIYQRETERVRSVTQTIVREELAMLYAEEL